MKLKTNSDRLLTVAYLPEEDVKKDTLFILALTHGGYGLRYKLNEVPVNGAKAAGVKAIDLREDVLAAVLIVDEKSQVGILTQRGAFKRMKVSEITATARARRGVQILRELKRNPHRVILSRVLKTGENLSVITDKMETIVINPFDHPNVDRYSNGSFIIDTDELGVPLYIKMQISDGESEN